MNWVPSQVASIIMNYAHNGVAYCPHDHSLLTVVPRTIPGSRYIITVHVCPTCGNDTSSAIPQVKGLRLAV